MLTIYVIPCDDMRLADKERLEKSFSYTDPDGVPGRVDCNIIHVDHRRLFDLDRSRTPWYGYLFAHEWLSEGLAFAMPFFLSHQNYDLFVLSKKVYERRGANVEQRWFLESRIFRSYVTFPDDSSRIPVDVKKLRFERIMDGWILEPERIIH